MSDNLDGLCLWMRYLRLYFKERGGNTKAPHFHLLMPAYRTTVIEEPLSFSNELHPLTIHGVKHDFRPLVQMNLPSTNLNLLEGIGLWSPPKLSALDRFIPWKQEILMPSSRILGHVTQAAVDSAQKALVKPHRPQMSRSHRRGLLTNA
ncbi:hypothetical protein BT63DRAFT_269999 [Microthyrium microscopicum]|uniref:Uncharacterized protein n=1 Tax=Microthyrium microscopicum TaxID=703497 RepID=A0A6A6U887_9PEZI|nr:hypothetical protein BT63DRAFT_269999 [Microthyrium microscopicum]